MNYADDKEVHLGDSVIIDGKYHGVVVANIDGAEYSEQQPKEKWEYLGSGVIIDTDFGGLVHYQQENTEREEIVLSSRGSEKL